MLAYPRDGSAQFYVMLVCCLHACMLVYLRDRFAQFYVMFLVACLLVYLRDGSAHSFTCCRYLLVACLLNVLSTCLSFSGTDLLRQFYVLPH